MPEFFKMPAGIANVPLWEEHCRRIHARAKDLIEGKLSLIETAQALQKLAIWTRAERDPDLSVFTQICGDLIGLPIGEERQFWAKRALEREDVSILAVEERWRQSAIDSATRLVQRYRWALAARQRRRQAGHQI